MTDYYGNLTDGSVVKSYRTNGIATLTDYGDYDEIINLTDGTVPCPERWHDHLPAGRKGPARDLLL